MSNVSDRKFVVPCGSRLRRVVAVIAVYGTSAAIVIAPLLWWLCK